MSVPSVVVITVSLLPLPAFSSSERSDTGTAPISGCAGSSPTPREVVADRPAHHREQDVVHGEPGNRATDGLDVLELDLNATEGTVRAEHVSEPGVRNLLRRFALLTGQRPQRAPQQAGQLA